MKVKNKESILDRTADQYYDGQYVIPHSKNTQAIKEDTKKAIEHWKQQSINK